MGIATIASREVWHGKRSGVHCCQIDSVFVSRDSDVGIGLAAPSFRVTRAEYLVPRECQEAARLRMQVALADNRITRRRLSKPIAENTRSIATGYIQQNIPKVDCYCLSAHNDRDPTAPKALPPRLQNIVAWNGDSNLEGARVVRLLVRDRFGA